MTEERFDEILKEMREEVASPDQVSAARDRVWERLTATTSLACGEIRPELKEYLAGGLTDTRRLLVDDHLGRCAECRRALAEARGESTVVTMPIRRRAGWTSAPWTKWALAAGVALVALYAGRDRIDTMLAPSGPRATVVAVNGSLYRLPQSELKAGSTLSENDVVRTGAGSRAVLRLADGSQVELNQRTELTVKAAWSGQTIQLDRGDVIVQAAKQRRGYLRVATRDSVASVKGTVFAVTAASAGSLVSVVEGSVAVAQPGTNRLLTAGHQAASNPSLERVKVRQAISWSQEAEKYYSLLYELSTIEKQLAETAPTGVRTKSQLLRQLPANTWVYFAIPNLDGTMRNAIRIVEQRTRENAALAEWWESDAGRNLKRTVERLQAITPLLGDEVVVVLTRAENEAPLVMAEVQPGREDALRTAIDRFAEEAGAAKDGAKFPYRLNGNLLMISDNAAHLTTLATQLGTGTSSPFAQEIAQHYQRGVSWMAAVDVMQRSDEAKTLTDKTFAGLGNMRYLFFEQRSSNGRDENEATLSFAGARTGIASWLAAPGSLGSPEYISSDAVAVFSVSTRNPKQALEELLAATGTLPADLQKLESETGVNLMDDVAGALGTDFTVAVEQPTLPIPGWVGVFEVIRPSNLEEAARKLVEAHNRHLTPEQASHKATYAQETVNGRLWTTIASAAAPATLYWTYDRGYLIVSTDRALATRAIAIHDSGSSLMTSLAFQERFPSGNSTHHSGFVWFNTKGLLADLAGLVQNATLKNLLASREPLLIVLDGETERIRASSRTRLTSLILDGMMLSGAHSGNPKKL